jgi:hypothetical protein
MRTYEFKVREVLERTIRVDANSMDEAETMAELLYDNETIVLDADDLVEDDRERITYVADYPVINTDEGIQHFIGNEDGVNYKFD